MENKGVYIKGIITGVVTFISGKLEGMGPALLWFMLLMVVDYISGMLASKKEALEHPNEKEYGWSSKKGLIGIYKKVGYIVTVLVAVSTDYLLSDLISEIGIDYKGSTIFGLLVLVWFILNEMLSILENAGRMGVKLPQSLVKVICRLKNNVDRKED
ncbi:MAG: phage holin family protein [Lachnospiraceae bacterium]|nr:phage holin family protein [Lachnospiraceae bacterium]